MKEDSLDTGYIASLALLKRSGKRLRDALKSLSESEALDTAKKESEAK